MLERIVQRSEPGLYKRNVDEARFQCDDSARHQLPSFTELLLHSILSKK
jgi:hypothetical protein